MRILFFAILTMTMMSCSQSGAQAQAKLNANDFEAMLAKDKSVQLVDVRTPREYASGHIEGARLINYYDANFAQQIGNLDKSKPVMVYCAAGSRSAGAADQLTKMGFKKVYDLQGGMNAWRAAQKKTVQ